MNKQQKHRTISISLPEYLNTFITKFAKDRKIRRTELIKRIISEWVDKQLWISKRKK